MTIWWLSAGVAAITRAARTAGWCTESRDGGRTWSEGTDSALPNPNAAVDFLRLKSGHHLLVYNHSFTNRTPLSAALSLDGAKTFSRRIDLESNPTGDFGYPTVLQTRDGKIHVLYTSDERTVVRRLVLTEEELTSGVPAR